MENQQPKSSNRTVLMLLLMLCLPYYAARTNTTPIPKAPPKRKLLVSSDDHKLALREMAASVKQEEFLVTGTGAPRAEFEQCNREAVQLETMLKSKGLVPIEKILCVNPPGDNDSFVPSFRAKSTLPVRVDTIVGARYSTLTYCELEREKIADDAARSGIIIESTCKASMVTDLANHSAEFYQPAVVVIRESAPELARKYSSVEVLVESASQKLGKALNQPE